MFAKLKIVLRLFRKSFAFVGVLYFIALVMFLSVIELKESYKLNLQNEFATKQPHVKVTFIDDNTMADKLKVDKLKNEIILISSLIEKVSEFVSSKKFYSSVGSKEGGNSQYQGDIKVIGLSSTEFVYDFFEAEFTSRAPFTVPYTPVEFLYAFKKESNSVVFNSALFNSYFPAIATMENFYFVNGSVKIKTKSLARFDDYDKQPILYTNIDMANKMLNNPKNKIDGFFVNAKNLEDIDKLTKILKERLPSDTYIVKSWLEDRQKQFMMFNIFEVLSFVIVAIIISLSLLFIMLMLYDAIVKKSYHLSVLLTIGFRLKREIFTFIVLIMLIDTVLVLSFINYTLPELTSYLSLPFSHSMIIDSSVYLGLINIFFLVISYILINSSYGLKAKSIF
ncbi:hypothetical protein N9A28_07335 [Sulfurimonas sp.]|nr:hypothetical protein [Sulfurimonas sp.]